MTTCNPQSIFLYPLFTHVITQKSLLNFTIREIKAFWDSWLVLGLSQGGRFWPHTKFSILFPLESEFRFNKSSVTIISFFSSYDEKSHTLLGKQKGSGAANPYFPLFFLPPSYVCSLQGPFCASPALASSALLCFYHLSSPPPSLWVRIPPLLYPVFQCITKKSNSSEFPLGTTTLVVCNDCGVRHLGSKPRPILNVAVTQLSEERGCE